MNEIRAYKALIPLVYNQNDVYSKYPNTASEFDFKGSYNEILVDSFLEYSNNASISVCSNNGNLSCKVDGFLGVDQKDVVQKINPILQRICVEISIVINLENSNLHCHQPRVEVDWKNAEWNDIPFGSEGCSVGIGIMRLKESFMLSLKSIIHLDDVKMDNWQTEHYRFLANEFYLALGTENIKSKYYHLYSLIEYCLREYSDCGKAKPLFSDEDIEKVSQFARHNMDNAKEKTARLEDAMHMAKNIGKAKQLLNILNSMGIYSFRYVGKTIELEIRVLKILINQRSELLNARKKLEEVYKQYEQLKTNVGWLFDIDIRIIKYLRGNGEHLKEDLDE